MITLNFVERITGYSIYVNKALRDDFGQSWFSRLDHASPHWNKNLCLRRYIHIHAQPLNQEIIL